MRPAPPFQLSASKISAFPPTARLVRYLNGKFELLGGTDADRAQAREWCSLFLHDAVFTSASPRMHPTVHRPVDRGPLASPWPVECAATPLGRPTAPTHLHYQRA